jgi:hypothetical protein
VGDEGGGSGLGGGEVPDVLFGEEVDDDVADGLFGCGVGALLLRPLLCGFEGVGEVFDGP